MIPPQAPGWRNPRVFFTLLAVFLCGVSAGMLVMAAGAPRWMHVQARPAWRDSGTGGALERLRKDLDLTPAQAEQMETILDDYFTYYHTLQAQLDDVRSSGKQRMLRILDENQKKKFEKITSGMQDKPLH